MNYRPPEKDYELWDSWLIEKDGTCHLFHLCRDWWSGDNIHRNYIGHASSTDLLHWKTHDYITLFSDITDDWDSNQRILTGNIFRNHDGLYYMTYGSAKSQSSGGPPIPRIGIVVSEDLFNWHKSSMNPILSPAPPYRANDDNRWPLRDASLCRTPDNRYEAIFCTRLGSGPFFERGVIGQAFSDDLEHWVFDEPLLQTDRIQEPEVPSRYYRNGRHYLLFCAGFGLGGRAHHHHYPIIDKATYYAVANAFDGPFHFSMQNVLSPGTAYVGRIIDFDGEPLFFHHIETRRSGFAIPKAVSFDNDRISLFPWSGIKNIFTGQTSTGFEGADVTSLNMTASIRDGDLLCDARHGPVLVTTGSEWKDVHLSLVIHPRCEFSGISLRGKESEYAIAIFYERDADRLVVTRVACRTNYRLLSYNYPDLLGIYERKLGPAAVLKLTLTLRSDAMDIFLDEVHIFSLTVEGVGSEGPVVLYADGGECIFQELSIHELEEENNYIPDVVRPAIKSL